MLGFRTRGREKRKNAFKMHTFCNNANPIYKHFVEIAEKRHARCFQQAKESSKKYM
jgi:hypothetical protein